MNTNHIYSNLLYTNIVIIFNLPGDGHADAISLHEYEYDLNVL